LVYRLGLIFIKWRTLLAEENLLGLVEVCDTIAFMITAGYVDGKSLFNYFEDTSANLGSLKILLRLNPAFIRTAEFVTLLEAFGPALLAGSLETTPEHGGAVAVEVVPLRAQLAGQHIQLWRVISPAFHLIL
jgi:hypothetical protein